MNSPDNDIALYDEPKVSSPIMLIDRSSKKEYSKGVR